MGEFHEFVAQGDRVLVVGFARGEIKATGRTWEDHWVFAITVRNGKLTHIREFIDTQALARACEMDASRRGVAAGHLRAIGSGQTADQPWIGPSHAARSSNAQP